MDNDNLHSGHRIVADGLNDYSLESGQRVPHVGLYPESSPDWCDSLYSMDHRPMQHPYNQSSGNQRPEKNAFVDNPSTDSGVGLDSGCESLYQSSGFLSTGSVSHKSIPVTTSTDSTWSIEKQIQHLNIHDQHDSLLRDSSIIQSFTSDSYISGTTFNRSLEETEPSLLWDIKEDFSSQQQFWHDAFNADEDGDTKLHIAIIQRAPEAYNILYLSTAHQCVNISNLQFYQTPLHLAVHTSQYEVARELMAWGALVSPQDHNGDTPLHIACRRGDFNCVKVLTTPLGHTDISNVPYAIPFQRIPQDTVFNYKGQTCLHVAATNKHLDIVRYLVEVCGADMNAQEHTAGRTVLHAAVEGRDLPLVQLLVSLSKHGLDIEAVNFAQRTPLQLAVDNDLDEITECLVGAGASRDNVEIDGSLDLAMDDSDDELSTPLEYDDLSIYGQPIALDPSLFTIHSQ